MLLLILLSPCASGNPLILIPTGTTLTTGQFRVEGAFSSGNEQGNYSWFATGFLRFEANLIRFQKPGAPAENLVGAQWCFLPETFITPAVSFGGTDIASQSREGIGAYVAATKHISTEGVVPVLKEFSATAGIGVHGVRGFFAGFEAKLPLGIFAQGEFDSRDFNATVGWQPIPLLRLKAYSIRTEFYYGAELVPVAF
jgi:hypothetical protein